MLNAKGISFTYPDNKSAALSDVSFSLESGEFIAVAGPSGSGKSTLLRCCNGLIPNATGGIFVGEVFFHNVSLNGLRTRDLSSQIGFVQQDPDFQSVTGVVETEIAFGLENTNVDEVTMRRRVEDSLDALNIAHLRNRPTSTLSGGEKQRVAIAAALATTPKLLLLDEPLSQLDPQGAEDVMAAVVRLRDELGMGVLMVEHRLDRLMKEVDSVMLMENGRIKSIGDPRFAFDISESAPVLAQIAKRLGWPEIPLTVAQARRVASDLDVTSLPQDLSSMGKSLLKIDNVSIAYEKNEILRDVSLEVSAGERVAVIGRNGSGKTSLLKAIVGIKKVKRGEIVRHGRPAYIPQNPNAMLFAPSVRESIEETLRLLDRKNQSIDSIAEQFHITDLLSKHPRNLSMGQRELAALATVAVGDPDVLLADEPTRGMDGWLRESLAQSFQGISEHGKAVVFATHDIEFAARVATRVIVLADQQIIADGDVREVLCSSIFAPITSRIFPGVLHPNEIMEKKS